MYGAASGSTSNTVEVATLAGLAAAAVGLLAAATACVCCRPKTFVKLQDEEGAKQTEDSHTEEAERHDTDMVLTRKFETSGRSELSERSAQSVAQRSHSMEDGPDEGSSNSR